MTTPERLTLIGGTGSPYTRKMVACCAIVGYRTTSSGRSLPTLERDGTGETEAHFPSRSCSGTAQAQCNPCVTPARSFAAWKPHTPVARCCRVIRRWRLSIT